MIVSFPLKMNEFLSIMGPDLLYDEGTVAL